MIARLAFWLLLGAGVAGLAHANYLQLKAVVAQQLIAWSWHERDGTGDAVKPWSWADFSAVAMLRWQDEAVYVLSSTSGQALAFGPGHLVGSARPGGPGRSIIAGHNDSHFAFLEDVHTGDTLELDAGDGVTRAYTVSGIEVVDSRHTQLLRGERDELLLVTCYPFRSVQPNSPLRLVVSASQRREPA
ncbi:MAG: class GN sortase [Pseudomonadota bacterium]